MSTTGYVNEDTVEQDFVDAAGRLVAYLKEAHRSEDAATIFVMAAYITQMEEKMDQAMLQIAELKNQMNLMQENQNQAQEKLTGYLEEITEALHVQYGGMKSELKKIKQEFSNQAHKIVENAKQKGAEALNAVAEFFKIKERMQGLRGKIETMLSGVEQAVERIDAFGRGMRQAKRNFGNAMRALMGKPEKENKQRNFSLTEAFKKPLLAQKKLLEESLFCVNKIMDKCEQLSTAARDKKSVLQADALEDDGAQKKETREAEEKKNEFSVVRKAKAR